MLPLRLCWGLFLSSAALGHSEPEDSCHDATCWTQRVKELEARVAALEPGKTGPQLVVPVQVSYLDEMGRLPIPSDKYVVIEVGANTQNTIAETLLPTNDDTFVLTFEPLLDKYGTLLSRNSAPDRFAKLGFHHSRGLVLPIAVASGEPFSWRHFRVHAVDGCSSLLVGSASPTCAGVVETRGVPTVPLSYVLDVWLGGRRVDYVKIDAQGADLDVVASAGSALRNVASLSVEVPTDYAASSYAGELKCSDALSRLDALNLAPVGAKRMHDAAFVRVNFGFDAGRHRWVGCDAFPGLESIEILLCHWPGCVLDSVRPGERIPGVRHSSENFHPP